MRYGVCGCSATIARLGLSTLRCEIDRRLTHTARTSEEAVIAPPSPRAVKLVMPRTARVRSKDPHTSSCILLSRAMSLITELPRIPSDIRQSGGSHATYSDHRTPPFSGKLHSSENCRQGACAVLIRDPWMRQGTAGRPSVFPYPSAVESRRA